MTLKITFEAETPAEIFEKMDEFCALFSNSASPSEKVTSDVLASQTIKGSKRILPRFKALTGMSDLKIAELIGVSRPTVQAYIGGRLDEKIKIEGRKSLAAVVLDKRSEIDDLLRDLQ